jgi:hypothetical protein
LLQSQHDEQFQHHQQLLIKQRDSQLAHQHQLQTIGLEYSEQKKIFDALLVERDWLAVGVQKILTRVKRVRECETERDVLKQRIMEGKQTYEKAPSSKSDSGVC